ncbi:egg secreted protein ESP15-like [Schistosoma mansoni]|uniref:Egg secreted protein ESP15-like n=1 Tax=Schistosoma mansoni TaxID=6183 RepID=C4QPR8_SCHMA|nr:egg secreted protein ESP15-like [Schistosoma mansoni]|eukprot:XP_018644488.1 egg secreted protein ESP15-like [Schistosoma mansoni]
MHGIWCKVPVSVVIWIHSTLFQFTFKVFYELKQNNTFPLPGDGWTITCNETYCCENTDNGKLCCDGEYCSASISKLDPPFSNCFQYVFVS